LIHSFLYDKRQGATFQSHSGQLSGIPDMGRFLKATLLSVTVLIGSIGLQGPAVAAPEKILPEEVKVSKEMAEAGKISRFQLEVKRETYGTLHVTVICPRREKTHLANATLEYLQKGAKPVNLPVQVTVDNSGNDRLVFSTSSGTAAQCLLSLHIGPKISADKSLKVNTIYRIMLVDFIPPKETSPKTSKDKPKPAE